MQQLNFSTFNSNVQGDIGNFLLGWRLVIEKSSYFSILATFILRMRKMSYGHEQQIFLKIINLNFSWLIFWHQ